MRSGYCGWGIRALVLRRIALRVLPESFRVLVEGLLSLSTLKTIDFGSYDLSSPALTDAQARILAEEVGEAKHLQSLSINVKDSYKISAMLGQMIADNKSLTSFSSNHRDDKHLFPVFLASILDNLTLRNLAFRGGGVFCCLCRDARGFFSIFSSSAGCTATDII